MSDDSPRNKRKRNIRCIENTSSNASTSSSSPIVTTSRRRVRRRYIEDDSESESGSSIEINPKRKRIPRVASDQDSDSSGSVIVQRAKRPPRVVSDSSDSDHGFEGSSSSWETDVSDSETKCTTKVQDTGVDSDSSDGQSEKCPICLISFTNQEIGTPESCDHMFCVECIQEWSKNMNTCPVDRQEYHVILVRGKIDGNIYRQIAVQEPNPQNDVEDIVEDPTFCEVCGLSDREDRMLLCDGCDLGFHLECLNPPLAVIPPGQWFCNDCSPEDVVNPEIDLLEWQLLLDEADTVGRPTNSRRRASSRLVPRTRQSERVRHRIATNRNNQTSTVQSTSAVTSTTSRPRKKKRKKKPRYRLVYKIDEATGETVAVKQRARKRKKRRKPVPTLRTVKKRLAFQLGMCAPRSVPQSLPDVRVQQGGNNNLHSQRYQAGIPTLRLFGTYDDLDVIISEDEGDGSGMVARRGFSRPRRMLKRVSMLNPVSSSTDILGSILDVQTRFHSKATKFKVGSDGKVTMETSNDQVLRELNNFEGLVRRTPASYSNETRNDSLPTSSGQRNASPDPNSTAPTSTVETSTVAGNSSGANLENSNSQDYTHSDLCTIYDVNLDDQRAKKKEDNSEDNTPRSGTPASESEIDIYSDIETVSTSKADDCDVKAPSPLSTATPNGGTDDENNDSETDMVIDTDKANPEPEESKEEAAVTSTVDNNVDVISMPQTVTSTSEIQSQAIQSSNQLFDDKNNGEKQHDEDEDSEDGCPNFSIYSKESITMAKNTDITLGENPEETNQVGEVSSSPEENTAEPEQQKPSMSTGLYSDSEDETVVKKGVENSFGIIDIRNMTEDISEEERSYTPCLDERPHYRQGIEGLDTEMISDEDRNDFDESHELKTASDGDALEINAKESELDFTRPEDYEEGEIVDKSKNKKPTEETKKKEEESGKKAPKKDVGNKENENQNGNNKESAFKKLSTKTKERNYREKDKERSKSRDRKDAKKEKNKKEKRKEIERYDVRALIAEKPRRIKDKFGRDIRRSLSRSRTRTPSVSRSRRSASNTRRSSSRTRRSSSRDKGRKKRRRSRTRRSLSRSKTRSPDRRRSRSRTKKRKRSLSRDRRKKSRERSKGKTKKQHRSRSRHRSRSPSPPNRTKEWNRRHSRDWTPSFSRSRSPEARHLSPSWTPPRIMDAAVKPHNLTVILTNDAKKKKEKKKKAEKKTKENDRTKKRKRNERTPPPSKEVFASGDNILVSVSFNKDNETRDVSTKKKKEALEEAKKAAKKDKVKKKKKNRDLTGVKPVAIIDLERSPFKELTPSPKDVIVLSDSDNEEARNVQKGICDSSQQVSSPERLVNSYTTGPKTPPEPQVKFTLTKQTQMRAITNPLHEPDDIEQEEEEEEEEEGDTQEVADTVYKGPNTPPEPPNSPPSSPDAYDPFEPTKSRSASPEPMQTTQSNGASMDDNRDDSIMEVRNETDKSNNSVQQPDVLKSLTPPLADVQPADSQSSIQATPESSLGKSPERSTSVPVQTQTVSASSKPVTQTIPFSSSLPTSLLTSTPASTSLAPLRINILNTSIITPPHVVSSLPQRIVLPNTVKSSPVKISPTKMPSKTPRKTNSRNQNGSETVESNLGLDSPYSPGSSDYEDLFEPPAEGTKAPAKATASKNTKSPTKAQNAFDALFGTSPFNKVKTKPPDKAKFNKKPAAVSGKGTKQVGVKLDEDNLKILDELPNSAVEMQVKDKFLKKLNRQERVVEEVKLVLKPHYNKKHVNKEEYKDILRRAVPKICHNKSGEINPTKIKNLIEAYVKKIRHSKKVTSSSSSVNPQKA